jgi:iron complex outermembrane receptor protein
MLLVLILTTLAAPDRVRAQATANALAVAEDAFGSAEGDESVGIYDQTAVRGFNLEAAGNYRINGRYFVRNSGVSSFFLEKTIVRIGYNALWLDHPGPSGVVDYRLRDPRRGEPSLLTVGLDSYEQPFAELHIKYRSEDESLAASIGASRRFRWADEQGGEGRDALLAGTVRATHGRTRWQIFGGEYRYDRSGRFRVLLDADANALPREIERGRYLGQSWAMEGGARRILGGLADLDLDGGWSARATTVFSQEAPDRKFTQLFSGVGADSLAQSSVIISPEQRSSSHSGELQLGRTFRGGGLVHSAALTARVRVSRNRFGGERVIATGTTVLGQAATAVAFPDLADGAALLSDRIEQQGFGLTYQVALRDRFRAGGGLLYTDYSKRFADAAGAVSSSDSAPWLYNLAAAFGIAEGIELYSSYSRGLEEAGIAPTTATNANAVLQAAIAAQKELGIRYAVRPDLTLIVAGFETRKPQVGIHAQSGAFDFLGNVRHRGVETSLSGALNPRLSAVVGAAYTDAEVSGTNVSAGVVGGKPVGVPAWRAVASANYQASQRFSLDIGIEYSGRRAARSRVNGIAAAQLELPDATFIDVGARYRLDVGGHPITVRAQLLNALDRFAWKPAPGETLDYAPQRSFRLLVTTEL